MVPKRHSFLGMILVTTAVTTGCEANPTDTPSARVDACEPVNPQGPAAMALEHLTGAFRIVFVTTAGSMTGHSAAGTLRLRPQEPALVDLIGADTSLVLTQPVIGQLDLALDSIGATRMGDPMSDSNAMPGVGLYVTRLPGGTGVVGRVGAGSNARGLMPFDAGYFTLFIQRVNSDGIWGIWRSSPGAGGLVTPEARGHFCAARLTTG